MNMPATGEEPQGGMLQTAALDPMTPKHVRDQVNLIQEVMREVMKEGVHYGTIPGTDKPTLYKAGAEKLCLVFRLAQTLDIEKLDLPDGHREYTVTCTLRTPNGIHVGQGIGVCTTMESKYRYRWDAIGKEVPKNYWDDRDSEKLGGPQFVPRKVSGKWMIYQKIEQGEPADYYNTVAKMAKKRAHVDATLTCTAASDIFDQDIEDLVESGAPVNDKTTDNRPGKRAANKAESEAEADPERKKELVAHLNEVADKGTDALMDEWQKMSADDRAVVGSAFGDVKKRAKAADGE